CGNVGGNDAHSNAADVIKCLHDSASHREVAFSIVGEPVGEVLDGLLIISGIVEIVGVDLVPNQGRLIFTRNLLRRIADLVFGTIFVGIVFVRHLGTGRHVERGRVIL